MSILSNLDKIAMERITVKIIDKKGEIVPITKNMITMDLYNPDEQGNAFNRPSGHINIARADHLRLIMNLKEWSDCNNIDITIAMH
jgi:hypothetical protein